jgi:hypothetical protein
MRKGKRNTAEIHKQSNDLLIILRTMLQPRNDLAGQQNNKDKHQDPARRPDFPADRFHLFLRAYPEKPSLSFVKHQFQASRAINALMSNCQEIILLREYSRRLLRHLITTTGASQVACFSLTEGARNVGASCDFKIAQAILPSLGKSIICSCRFQKALPA